MAHGYLHGYSRDEHRRLHAQAKVFEPLIHRDLVFPPHAHLLEVGCGAGAQTAILLRRNPTLRVTAVDLSEAQLAAARAHLARSPHRRQVTFVRADATALPFAGQTFDAALSVWLLEHVPAPVQILKEVRRVLKKGRPFHVREVYNHSFDLFPVCPEVRRFWDAYNTLQFDLGGNPEIGIELPNLLAAAGFKDITLRREDITYDVTAPRLRRVWLDYWRDLMLSGVPQLLAHKRIEKRQVAAIRREYAALQKDPRSVFHVTPVFGHAKA